MGTVNASCLDALQRLYRVVRSTPDLLLTLVTSTPGWVLRKWGLRGERLKVVPATLSREGMFAELASADMVFLPLGLRGALDGVEYKTIFPTRTIEYLLCRRPILAHVPSDSYMAEFLRARGCALVVDSQEEEALAAAVQRLRADRDERARLVRAALAAAAEFEAGRVAHHLREVVAGLGESAEPGEECR